MTEPSPQLVRQTARPLRRLTAGVIDTVVVLLLTFVAAIFIASSSALADDSSIANPWGSDPIVWAIGAAQILLGVLYYGLAHAQWGQTIGKRVVKIKVVSVSTGQVPAFGQAAIRALFFLGAPLVPYVGWLLALVDLTWMGLDGRHQCLHDRLVRTIVIKKP
ncbi:RDD family protein [Planotetraspora thailandica]|uniref:RDD family protein n=1 Tax=Planotetraspora thailandica TaxID=487172 RepID=UPI00194EB218|nr:RDD family protein [Planotetraspora thailandica]